MLWSQPISSRLNQSFLRFKSVDSVQLEKTFVSGLDEVDESVGVYGSKTFNKITFMAGISNQKGRWSGVLSDNTQTLKMYSMGVNSYDDLSDSIRIVYAIQDVSVNSKNTYVTQTVCGEKTATETKKDKFYIASIGLIKYFKEAEISGFISSVRGGYNDLDILSISLSRALVNDVSVGSTLLIDGSDTSRKEVGVFVQYDY